MAACQTLDSGPGCLNLKLYAGDRNVFVLEFLADGDPWDMTGAVVSAQARKTASDTAVALTAEVTEVDAYLGRYTLAWDGEEIRTLLGTSEAWSGVWDLQVLEVGQTLPRTVLRGELSAMLDVTRVTP